MIVIFNGPPGSGKDEAASYFKQNFGYKSLSFKYALFKETIKHFNVDHDWFMLGYEDRDVKEKPEDLLNGMSRREAMIHVSEDNIKPKYGKSYFGIQVSQEIEADENYAISDGGFIEELEPIIEKVGHNSIVFVQLTREGCSYSSDSRRYYDGVFDETREFVLGKRTEIEQEYVLDKQFPIMTYRIHNNASLEQFHSALSVLRDRIKIFEKLSKILKKHPVRATMYADSN